MAGSLAGARHLHGIFECGSHGRLGALIRLSFFTKWRQTTAFQNKALRAIYKRFYKRPASPGGCGYSASDVSRASFLLFVAVRATIANRL